jgi:hypothetical protein
MLSDVCGAKPQVALSPRNKSTRVGMHSHDSHFPMLELLCCGLVVLLLQLLQQSCWQAPCGEVGRVGQAARAGSLEKDRAGQDYDATLFLNRQHAEPLNMQTLFFSSLDGLPGGALGPRAGSAGSRGLELTCVSSAEAILPANLQEQLQHQFHLASQFPASVAGRSRQRPWVSCVCSASRFDAIEACGWKISTSLCEFWQQSNS